MEKKINDFIIFCIEVYKLEKKMTGKEIYEIFEKYGVINYLQEGYEMLHTQGDKWLIQDIEQFLKNKGYME